MSTPVQGKLLKTLRFLHFFCILAGLTPYTINDKGQVLVNIKSILQSGFGFVHGLILLYFIQIYDVVEVELETNQISVNMNVFSSYFWRFLSVIFILAEFVNRHKIVKVYQKLQKVEHKIILYNYTEKDITSIYYKLGTFTKYGVAYILLSAFSVVFLDKFYTLYDSMAKKSIWISFALYFVMLLIMPLTILKIVVVNFLVKQRLEWINLKVDKMTFGEKKVSEILN